MSRSDDAGDVRGHERLIRDAKERAFQARRALRAELPHPSDETMRAAAEATSAYADALTHHADADDPEWTEQLTANPDALLTTTGQSVQTVQHGWTTRTEPVNVKYYQQLDASTLLQLGKELDAVAKELGFAAAVNRSRQLYDAGKRDEYPDPVVVGIPKPQTGATSGDVAGLRHSKLYHDWYQRVACGDPNDYVIAISADPRSTGVSGTGKTTLGGGLAKQWFDHSEDGFDAETQYTLDPSVLAYEMYDETGELSVLVGDEMQGTPATTGLNSKRAMKNEAMDAVNAIAAGRSDRKTVILIVQDLKSLTKDALTFVDAWLLIRDDVNYVATHYGVAPDVFDLKSRQTKTPGVEEVTWDALPKDDPDYQAMEEKKQQAKRGQREYGGDGDGEDGGEPTIPKEARDQKMKQLYQQGIPQRAIGEAFDLSQSTVSQIINDQA